MTLRREQVDALLHPIAGARVTKKDNQSHVEAYDIRRRLTNIFGFGGWGEESRTVLIYEDLDVTVGQDKRPGVDVGYKATCTLTVYGIGPQGQDAVFTEEAFGGQRMGVKSRGDCHDFAIKTAESQALKRCAINLGDQFGLSLYNNGSLAPLVKYVLGADPAAWRDGEIYRPEQPATTGKVQEGSVAVTDHVTAPLAPETPAPEADGPHLPAPPVPDPDAGGGGAPPVASPPPVLPPDAYDDPPGGPTGGGDALPLVQDMLYEEVQAVLAGDGTVAQRRTKLTRILMRANEAKVKGALVGDRTLEAHIQHAIAQVSKR